MAHDSIYRRDLFQGEVAIITGGGTGIGRAIALELSHLGAEVVLASRDVTKCERTRDEILARGGKAHALACNVRQEAEVEALVGTTLERCGRLDHLVNNAGGQFVSPAEALSANGWRAVLETNLTGTFFAMRAAFRRRMREHGGGIVNIVADMWRGMPLMAHSGAARAGVVNLTQTCALEWAPHGVRVNAVAPGTIDSSGLKTYPDFVREALPQLAKETPAGRMGTEAEVASAVAFLLSKGARYVSGATLRVDGGSSLYRLPFALPEHDAWPRFDGGLGEA